MLSTIAAVFPDGTVATRRTAATYIYASIRQGSSKVRFHASLTAALKAAGRFGIVVDTIYDDPTVPVSSGRGCWSCDRPTSIDQNRCDYVCGNDECIDKYDASISAA